MLAAQSKTNNYYLAQLDQHLLNSVCVLVHSTILGYPGFYVRFTHTKKCFLSYYLIESDCKIQDSPILLILR